MNESTEHPLHSALHTLVREAGDNAADPFLVGLADSALHTARRRQRRALAGTGLVAAVVVAAAGITAVHGTTEHTQSAQPAGHTTKAARLSIYLVTSMTDGACTPASGGYSSPDFTDAIGGKDGSTTTVPTCFRVDPKKGFTVVRVVSAEASHQGYAPVAWGVDVTLSAVDRSRLATLTRASAAAGPGGDQLALVVDGKLQSVEMVERPQTDGRVFLGDWRLTASTARALALKLVGGR